MIKVIKTHVTGNPRRRPRKPPEAPPEAPRKRPRGLMRHRVRFVRLIGMTRLPANLHGRKSGRGVRPWLLIPKVLAVGLYFGALVTTAVVWFSGPRRSANLADPQVQAWIDQVSSLFRFLVVPALLIVMAMGVSLFLQHAAVFVRMRWWQVKMVSLFAGLPLGHLFMASKMRMLKHASERNWSIELQLECGFVLLILWSIWLIFLGRYKPRLWQNRAKLFRRNAMLMLGVVLTLGLAACWSAGPDIDFKDPTRPANLSIQFNVVGEAAPGDPLRQTSMYVLEPDHRLRVALGYRAQKSFYPAVVRTISAGEYDAIVRFVYARHLMAEPTSPIGEAAEQQGHNPPVLYRVDLSAWGLVNRYVSTAEESPPTAELLMMLVNASGAGLN